MLPVHTDAHAHGADPYTSPANAHRGARRRGDGPRTGGQAASHHSDALPHVHASLGTHSGPDIASDTNANHNSHPHAYPYSDADANPDANAYPHSYADSDAYPDADNPGRVLQGQDRPDHRWFE
ncbi:MAG: hypothetical protein OXK79_01305 [Chloroflexota bacterium]|nr:hypothetical protein [Chloroflexota bacterium]